MVHVLSLLWGHYALPLVKFSSSHGVFPDTLVVLFKCPLWTQCHLELVSAASPRHCTPNLRLLPVPSSYQADWTGESAHDNTWPCCQIPIISQYYLLSYLINFPWLFDLHPLFSLSLALLPFPCLLFYKLEPLHINKSLCTIWLGYSLSKHLHTWTSPNTGSGHGLPLYYSSLGSTTTDHSFTTVVQNSSQKAWLRWLSSLTFLHCPKCMCWSDLKNREEEEDVSCGPFHNLHTHISHRNI